MSKLQLRPTNHDFQVWHSPDFRTVQWSEDEEYVFSPLQADVVKYLWQYSARSTPRIGHHTILVEIESDGQRLIDLFRRKSTLHPAWGKMIISDKQYKRTVRLAKPVGEDPIPFA